MILAFVLLLQLQVPDAQQFVGPPKGQPLAGEELFRRTNEVGSLLRCPVCQGMSIADSPAEMAVNMTHQVRELLARGYTEEQILDYFEKSYGQFVLLRPKSTAVWMLPLLALVIGVVVVFVKLRNLQREPITAVTARNEQPTAVDDPYLARVRDLVGGEKS
ncbi:MAG TPA: cytochrome c-type biogenesis protein CcmH [Thermoanaerobaculia bacterium]|jgi:cytochrome c-type biogenesis protein CcmH|nr:cytochrome c-type biogenesis protein CcmH [Thermoanaerobaculia bacterium]